MNIAIILGSNRLERVEFASMTAFLASSMGDEVMMFATMDGVRALTKSPSIAKDADSAKKIEETEKGGRFLEYLTKA